MEGSFFYVSSSTSVVVSYGLYAAALSVFPCARCRSHKVYGRITVTTTLHYTALRCVYLDKVSVEHAHL